MTALEVSPPSSLSRSSLIKMEDRKRPNLDTSDIAPPSKKQATLSNGAGKSHPDADMPWKDDLEKIQKDAILRQISEYKRERKDLETLIRELRKKSRDHDTHIRTIDAWQRQLIDEIKLLMPQDGNEMELDNNPSALSFSEQKDFEQHLQSRSADIQSLVKRLFSNSQNFSPEVIELQGRVSRLLAAEKEHLAELESIKAEKEDLDQRLESASLRYMVAEKKLDRAKSITAAKLDKGMLLGGPQATTEDPGSAKREDNQVNGVADHGEELAELELEMKKAVAASETQKDQIAKLEEENARLMKEATELLTKSSTLSDDDYAKTELFKLLKTQHDEAVKKVNDVEATNAELKAANDRLQLERSMFQSQLESESRGAIAEKESTLNQVHTDLARVRGNRDELVADLAVKKASLDERSEALKKLKELTAAQDERIKALESENERLSSQAGDLMTLSSELDSMSAEEIRAKHQELEKKYSLLNGELTSMQNAYQKAQRLATSKVSEYALLEEKVAKLTAEKSKADQKYFATMKSKETREMEVRTLRMQTLKSSEVVTQLKEAEAASRALLTNMEKQLAEIRTAFTTKSNESRTLTQQSTSQASDIARLTAQVEELKKHMTTKDSKLAATSSACRSAETQAVEAEKSLSHTRKELETWKSKSGQHEQFEILRSIAYCVVCKKELRNTALKTCGHTFCNTCVDKQVQLRARKCPVCGKPFGINDHMRITL